MASTGQPPSASPTASLPSSRTPLRILVAPSSFKESAGADQIADWIEQGFRKVIPATNALEVYKFPLYDGEGFTKALVKQNGGVLSSMAVRGPAGRPLIAPYGLIDNGTTGVMDIASAAGLQHLSEHERNPLTTTSFGVGTLLEAVVQSGCTKIIIACGDSGTSDASVGLLGALGVTFTDAERRVLDPASGGQTLSSIDHINWPAPGSNPTFERIRHIDIEVVCNLCNYLSGSDGVARVYGPQKGATAEQVDSLAEGTEHFSRVLDKETSKCIRDAPGSGASGGIGAALIALGAKMYGRRESFSRYFDLDTVLLSKRWHLVVTGEGQLDKSSDGKATVEFAKLAKENGIPVVCLVGSRKKGPYVDGGHDYCIDWVHGIINREMTLQKAMRIVSELVRDASADLMRALRVGMDIGFAREAQLGW